MPLRIWLMSRVQLTVPRLGIAKSGRESKAPMMVGKMLSSALIFRGRTLSSRAKMLVNTKVSTLNYLTYMYLSQYAQLA